MFMTRITYFDEDKCFLGFFR